MTATPAYVVDHVDEKDVTVDWFFGSGHAGTKVTQLILILVGWFFAVLPVAITASALLNRDSDGGWWDYQEGFDLWDDTMRVLGILTVVFIIGFLVLHLVHRSTAKERNRRRTYNEERLALRLEVAEAWYSEKFGPEALRLQRRTTQIQPYSDIETYELRGLYDVNGID